MADIKLIALDLDGTTLDNTDHISQNTIETLNEAVRRGIHVVVATGRPISALPKDIMNVEGIEYTITSNGAVITRLADKKVIHKEVHDSAAIEKIVEILKETPYMTEIFVDGIAFIEEGFFYDPESHKVGEKRAAYIRATRTPVKSIYQHMLEHKDNIENINVNFYNQEDRMRFWKEADALGIATVTSSFFSNVELGGLKASKAHAILKLGEILGIEAKNMMAAGDSPNDIEMLKTAGFAVAMGNAVDEVKAIADYVTDSNQNDGVAKAVRKFALGEEI